MKNISGNFDAMEIVEAENETIEVCFVLHFLFVFCIYSFLSSSKSDLVNNFGLFHIPEELFDFIAQHLSGTKLLQLSLVSKGLYQLTTSTSCMTKILLNIVQPMNDNDVELIQNSPRKYSAMKIHLEKEGKEVALIKKVLTESKFRDMTFPTSLDFCRYFETLARYLKKLIISFIEIDKGDQKIQFPMLEDLNANLQ
jgi:hypothetical protein